MDVPTNAKVNKFVVTSGDANSKIVDVNKLLDVNLFVSFVISVEVNLTNIELDKIVELNCDISSVIFASVNSTNLEINKLVEVKSVVFDGNDTVLVVCSGLLKVDIPESAIRVVDAFETVFDAVVVALDAVKVKVFVDIEVAYDAVDAKWIDVNDLLNLVLSIEVVIFAFVLVNKLVEVHVVVSLIFFDAVDSLYVAVVVNVILDVTFVVSKVSVSAIVKINQIKLKDQGFLVKPQLNTELPEFKQLH